jgi:hypothetical protein
MKAAIFEKPSLENLKIKDDVEQPKIADHDVLIKVKAAGVNPFDHITTNICNNQYQWVQYAQLRLLYVMRMKFQQQKCVYILRLCKYDQDTNKPSLSQ